jgi:hypothetical protein
LVLQKARAKAWMIAGRMLERLAEQGQPKTASPSPILSGNFQLARGAAVGEVAVTKDAGGIVCGNVSRCYQQPGENIRLVKWRYGGLFLLPLGIVWGNASRRYQQQGETISRQLSVLESDIVLAHLISPVDTEQAHRLCGGSSDHDSHRFRRNAVSVS